MQIWRRLEQTRAKEEMDSKSNKIFLISVANTRASGITINDADGVSISIPHSFEFIKFYNYQFISIYYTSRDFFPTSISTLHFEFATCNICTFVEENSTRTSLRRSITQHTDRNTRAMSHPVSLSIRNTKHCKYFFTFVFYSRSLYTSLQHDAQPTYLNISPKLLQRKLLPNHVIIRVLRRAWRWRRERGQNTTLLPSFFLSRGLEFLSDYQSWVMKFKKRRNIYSGASNCDVGFVMFFSIAEYFSIFVFSFLILPWWNTCEEGISLIRRWGAIIPCKMVGFHRCEHDLPKRERVYKMSVQIKGKQRVEPKNKENFFARLPWKWANWLN